MSKISEDVLKEKKALDVELGYYLRTFTVKCCFVHCWCCICCIYTLPNV